MVKPTFVTNTDKLTHMVKTDNLQVMGDGLSALRLADERSRNADVITSEVEKRIAAGSIGSGTIKGATEGLPWSIIANPIAAEANSQYQVEPWLVTAQDKDGIAVFQTIALLKVQQ
jgi:hypothetical protein